MSARTRREVVAPLESARSLALYALSLSAGAGAVLAWPWEPGRPILAVAAAAFGLAAAQAFGQGLAAWLSGTLEPRTRTRVRLWVGVLYAGVTVAGLAVGAVEPRLLRPEAALFVLLQGLFLLGSDVLGGPILAVANALVLVILSSFRGGPIAAASVTGYLGSLVFFLTLDHYVRRLSWYPARDVSLTGAALRQAAAVALPLALGLGGFFALYPPAPYARLPVEGPDATTLPEQVAEAYRRLLLFAIAGGGCVLLVSRLRGRGANGEPPAEEVVEAERSAEEGLPELPRGRRLYPGARGRIVRAYLRVLAQAPRLGFRLRPSLTPSHIAAELREPAAPVATLTSLFAGARYGPDEPGEADVRAAEAAAQAVLARANRRSEKTAFRSRPVLYAVCAVAALAAIGRAGPASPSRSREIQLGGRLRTYLLHVPPTPRDHPLPLVFVFHGGGGDGAGMERLSRFSERADREGFIAVYPDGLWNHWNDGREEAVSRAHRERVDDVGFVSATIEAVSRENPVDARRIFATGISNGGIFSHYLGARLSWRLAAIAPVVGGIAEHARSEFKPERPVSVLILQGTEDPLVPYHGGGIARGRRGRIIGTEEAARLWAEHDGCTGDARVGTLPDTDAQDGCRVRWKRWVGCRGQTEVAVYTLEGGGHTWPGGATHLPRLLVGRVCHDLDATELIWDFCRRHPQEASVGAP